MFSCVFFLLAAKVPIEETVETKKVETREGIPSKGTRPERLRAVAQRHVLQNKQTYSSSSTKMFDCFIVSALSFLFFIPLHS